MIGRDPRCQIVLDSDTYGGVSRQHVRVSAVPGHSCLWQVCDLNSANGTYLNGQLLKGCRMLESGDRIVLGRGGPEFVFELQWSNPSTLPPTASSAPSVPASGLRNSTAARSSSAHRAKTGVSYPAGSEIGAGGAYHYSSGEPSHPDAVTLSQLFPIVSTGRDLTRKAYLVPGIITVFFVVLMFVAVGDSAFFNILLATYLAGAAYYFIYQLCGKHKPWWLLLGSALVTMLLLASPILKLFLVVFRGILPGNIPDSLDSVSFPVLLIQMFFGAGLMEELIKAVPILIAYFVGTKLRSPHRENIGVWEPLDGILLGTASAVGFTLLETLGQYVPQITSDVTLQAGGEAGELALQILIPRVLGSVSGHMAYSGYLGYFIGLSVLKPSKRWRILGIGYVSASVLHALWNATGIFNLVVLALVGVLSYAFLSAAILKARVLSPNRSRNFATHFSRYF